MLELNHRVTEDGVNRQLKLLQFIVQELYIQFCVCMCVCVFQTLRQRGNKPVAPDGTEEEASAISKCNKVDDETVSVYLYERLEIG